MKNKLFLFLAITALVGIVVALDYGDAQAFPGAIAYSGTDSAYTRCFCQCVCPPTGYDWEYNYGPGDFSQVYCPCVVSVAPACTIYTHARAWKALGHPWEAVVADTMYVSRECQQGMGKGREGLIRVSDSLHVVASTVGNVVTIHVAGHWRICNYTDETVSGEFEVGMQKPGYPFWGGFIHFVPSSSSNWQDHVVVAGWSWSGPNWSLNDFTGGIDNDDCLWVHIDTIYSVPTSEVYFPTSLMVTGWKQHRSVPSSSEVGLIILTLALLGTGIGLIWWRKRRKAFAVA